MTPNGPRARGTETDWIEVRDLELLLFCGVLPEEQARRQPFLIDVDLGLDLAPAGASDNLDRTVNYGDLIDNLTAGLAVARFVLLEALAQSIADTALSYPLADEVIVRVRKLRPPVAAHVATTGVRIHRRRSPAASAS